MSTGPEPTEEELRAYEAEIKKIRVEHVLLEHIVTMVNLGMRRTGLAPGTESERDIGQVQLAIEAIRAVLPLIEQAGAPQAAQIRQALSQLQLAYVRIGGAAPPPGEAAGSPPPGPAEGVAPAGAGPAGGVPAGAPPAGAGPAGARPPGVPPAGPSAPADGPESAPGEEPGKPGEPGPAQRSGRLWVPGQ